MGKSSPPPPPDPRETAAAQTGTNISTAIANNTMGLVDQVTPYGSLSNEIIGYETVTDGATGESYQVPRYRQTTTLNDQQQATLDATQAAQTNLGQLASERSEFLRDYLPTTEAATDQIDAKLFELGTKRIDPRFARQREDLRTRLVNQGIASGSEAYNREMEALSFAENDAYNQLALQGRSQAINELNMPINQVTALLSGSQVSNPSVSLGQPQGAATTDYAGLVNQAYGQQLNAWNQQNAGRNSLLGGLFGAGGTILGAPAGSLAAGLF